MAAAVAGDKPTRLSAIPARVHNCYCKDKTHRLMKTRERENETQKVRFLVDAGSYYLY